MSKKGIFRKLIRMLKKEKEEEEEKCLVVVIIKDRIWFNSEKFARELKKNLEGKSIKGEIYSGLPVVVSGSEYNLSDPVVKMLYLIEKRDFKIFAKAVKSIEGVERIEVIEKIK